MPHPILVAKSDHEIHLLPQVANRHGLIAGATGTGKTVTLAFKIADDNGPLLLEKIVQVVRLIRSKGVGVYFVTQNPLDIPDTVLGSLFGGGKTRR